jgi:hypothetical protein
LEHQLLDRARYLEALADTADHADTRNLARRLQAAHQETIDWINSVLVEEASGEPTKVRPTPVQKAVGRLTSVVSYPTRWTAEWINGTAEAVAGARSRVGTVAEAAVDSLTAGRDAALLQAEQIATRKGARRTETALHRTRVLAGGLTEEELAVDNYDDLHRRRSRICGAATHRHRRSDRPAALRTKQQGPRGSGHRHRKPAGRSR